MNPWQDDFEAKQNTLVDLAKRLREASTRRTEFDGTLVIQQASEYAINGNGSGCSLTNEIYRTIAHLKSWRDRGDGPPEPDSFLLIAALNLVRATTTLANYREEKRVIVDSSCSPESLLHHFDESMRIVVDELNRFDDQTRET